MGNFSDVFKAVFATTKTTATHLPIVTSAGAPDGIISTSDLASVLGGMIVKVGQISSGNLDTDLRSEPFFFGGCRFAVMEGSSPYSNWGMLVVFNQGVRSAQIAIIPGVGCKSRFNNTSDASGWSAWA